MLFDHIHIHTYAFLWLSSSITTVREAERERLDHQQSYSYKLFADRRRLYRTAQQLCNVGFVQLMLHENCRTNVD